MKKTTYLIAALAVIACNKKPKDYLLFSGTIKNVNADYVYVMGHDVKDSLEIAGNGTFKDTLKIAKPGYYTLKIGNETSTFYLENGEDINLSIDTAQFDESIIYEGEGAPENNYLAKKYLTNEEVTYNNAKEFYALDEANYIKKVDSLKDALEKELNKAEVSNNFKTLEEKNLAFDEMALLYKYPDYHRYYAKDNTFEPSADFYNKFSGIDYDNEEDAKNYSSYSTLVLGDFHNKVKPFEGTDSLPRKSAAILLAKKSPTVQQIIMDELGDVIQPGGDEKTIAYYFDVFYPLSNDEAYKKRILTNYELFKRLIKGAKSPTFTFENYKGGKTSLTDLEGKYVYIDVWATWCGPCKAEIPFLQKIEDEFHNNNIAFVSISTDSEKDREKWKNFVNDQNLGGIQLYAPHEANFSFFSEYGVYYIPRFILLDPKGNIVSANAPRPSNPELKDLFGSLENF